MTDCLFLDATSKLQGASNVNAGNSPGYQFECNWIATGLHSYVDVPPRKAY